MFELSTHPVGCKIPKCTVCACVCDERRLRGDKCFGERVCVCVCVGGGGVCVCGGGVVQNGLLQGTTGAKILSQ